MRRCVFVVVVFWGMWACGGAVEDSTRWAPDDTGSTEHDSSPLDGGSSDAGRGRLPPEDLDSGAPPDLPDAAEFAECRASRYELHVEVTGDCGGDAGSFGVNGSRGTWSGRVLAGEYLQLDIQWGAGWGAAARNDSRLVPGTYTGEVRFPRFGVKVDGQGFLVRPGGTFTIADVSWRGGDQASLDRFLAWFDLPCSAGGTVRGCVRYDR